MDALAALLDRLSGLKTYGAVALAIAWAALYLKVPGAKDAIGGDNFALVMTGLVGAAAASFRAAQAKTHEAVADAGPQNGAKP